MAEEANLKECDFHTYCPRCEYRRLEETEDPCNECLSIPMNEDTHKPIHFREKI